MHLLLRLEYEQKFNNESMVNNLNEVREILIEMLEDLDDRLSTITNDSKQNSESDIRVFEEQSFVENDKAEDFLTIAACKEMEQIKQAISRIDDGTYGICLNCGQAIKKERLKGNVYSSHCDYCKTTEQ